VLLAEIPIFRISSQLCYPVPVDCHEMPNSATEEHGQHAHRALLLRNWSGFGDMRCEA